MAKVWMAQEVDGVADEADHVLLALVVLQQAIGSCHELGSAGIAGTSKPRMKLGLILLNNRSVVIIGTHQLIFFIRRIF
jgi:hypothetical protein